MLLCQQVRVAVKQIVYNTVINELLRKNKASLMTGKSDFHLPMNAFKR